MSALAEQFGEVHDVEWWKSIWLDNCSCDAGKRVVRCGSCGDWLRRSVVGNHTRVFGRADWRIIQFRSPDRRLLARLSRNNGTALG